MKEILKEIFVSIATLARRGVEASSGEWPVNASCYVASSRRIDHHVEV